MSRVRRQDSIQCCYLGSYLFQIKAEHFLCLFRSPDWLGGDGRHFAQIVDLPRNDQGVLQLLLGVQFELCGDAHELSSLQHLGIHHVRDDGLVFAREVFIQQLCQMIAGNVLFALERFLLSHRVSPLE